MIAAHRVSLPRFSGVLTYSRYKSVRSTVDLPIAYLVRRAQGGQYTHRVPVGRDALDTSR